MNLRKATTADTTAVVELYQKAAQSEDCAWNEYYPSMLEAEHDCETGNLFVLCDENSEGIIGALSIVPENELDECPCWAVKENASEIARVVVAEQHQGNGYAGVMVDKLLPIIKERGSRAVHLSVIDYNPAALKTYQRAGFKTMGEAEMYGGHYFLMELVF